MNCSICWILRAQSLKHQVSRLQEQRARIQWWNKGRQSTPARWFPQSRTAPSIPCRQHLPERLVLYPIHLWTKSIETHRTTTFMVEVLLVKPCQTLQPYQSWPIPANHPAEVSYCRRRKSQVFGAHIRGGCQSPAPLPMLLAGPEPTRK